MIDSESVEISVVVPVYNEEENLPIFMTKLVEVLKGLHKTHEVIFVDVGVQTEAERCSKRWPSTIRLFGSLNFSLTGGPIVLSYAIYRKDSVFIVA